MCAVLAVLTPPCWAREGRRQKATETSADEPMVLPAVLLDQRWPSSPSLCGLLRFLTPPSAETEVTPPRSLSFRIFCGTTDSATLIRSPQSPEVPLDGQPLLVCSLPR